LAGKGLSAIAERPAVQRGIAVPADERRPAEERAESVRNLLA